VPFGQTDGVQHQRGIDEVLVGERLHDGTQHDPLVPAPGGLGGIDDHGEVLHAVALTEEHAQAVGRLVGRHPGDPAVDRPQARTRNDEHPRRRVGPPLVEPCLVGAVQPVPVVRVLGQRDVREDAGGHRASSGAVSSQAVKARLS
jgi:hypothetical protein